jgi:hypothetical protein
LEARKQPENGHRTEIIPTGLIDVILFLISSSALPFGFHLGKSLQEREFTAIVFGIISCLPLPMDVS